MKIHDTTTSSDRSGFILPTIMLLSLALIAVGLSLIQVGSSVQSSLNSSYINRLATEAADAGTVYANYCLDQSGDTQTWGPRNGKLNLASNVNCQGVTVNPAPQYFSSTRNYRVQFSVGDLETRGDGATVVISTGTVQTTGNGGALNPQSNSVTRKKVIQGNTMQASKSASGIYKTCGIIGGHAYCWGRNTNGGGEVYAGDLGNGDTTKNWYTPVAVAGPLAGQVVTDIVAANQVSCAISGGTVYCWGQNDSGQLGNGTTTASPIPVQVQGLLAGQTVTDIGASGNTVCAIANAQIYCWGDNRYGTAGTGSGTAYYTTPQKVDATNFPGGTADTYTAEQLSTSGSYSENMCAIVNDKAYCWGDNHSGQVGNGVSGSAPVLSPTAVTGLLATMTVTAITQDGPPPPTVGNDASHTCAIAYTVNPSDARAYCWGDGNNGKLGRGSSADSSVPVAVDTTNMSGTVDQIAAGIGHTCALSDGHVYCWGNAYSGALGNGQLIINSSTPDPVLTTGLSALGTQTVTSIAAGGNRGCAIANAKTYCWGVDYYGQLGDGHHGIAYDYVPYPVESTYLKPSMAEFIF